MNPVASPTPASASTENRQAVITGFNEYALLHRSSGKSIDAIMFAFITGPVCTEEYAQHLGRAICSLCNPHPHHPSTLPKRTTDLAQFLSEKLKENPVARSFFMYMKEGNECTPGFAACLAGMIWRMQRGLHINGAFTAYSTHFTADFVRGADDAFNSMVPDALITFFSSYGEDRKHQLT